MAFDEQIVEGLNDQTDIGKEPIAHLVNILLDILRTRGQKALAVILHTSKAATHVLVSTICMLEWTPRSRSVLQYSAVHTHIANAEL